MHKEITVTGRRMASSLSWIKRALTPRNHKPSPHSVYSRLIRRHAGTIPQLRAPIDVIVPVYLGLEATRNCIESVLSSRPLTPFELIVINDCSPEDELSEWLEKLADHGRLTLLQNHQNLGFVRTANRGMSLHSERDVLLLNSDAIVTENWLDKLVACAWSQPKVATVTPFSNNATICSYPKFCEDNQLPPDVTLETLNAICGEANRNISVEIPTGVGFCLYIRREALDQIGLFNDAEFGEGYGEENDFCQRAIKQKWVNLLAADVFVQHLGGVSFGPSQQLRKHRAMEILDKLHPNYKSDVHRFVQNDPIKPLRFAVDLHRLRNNGLPTILAISHNRGGGTQRHIDDAAKLLTGIVNSLLLVPLERDRVRISWNIPSEPFALDFSINAEYDLLVKLLKLIRISRLHYHHTMGLPTRLWGLMRDLGVPYDFTAHDYYSACPQITLTRRDHRYCGERGIDDCQACLLEDPAPGRVGIEHWRSNYAVLLNQAERIFAPSEDTASRLKRYFPVASIQVLSHPEAVTEFPDPKLPTQRPHSPLKVLVIGALSQIKGADLLEDCARDAVKRNLPICFELVGFAYRHLIGVPKAALTVTGPYKEEDLLSILTSSKPDLVWFPAQWPETYSYTLSAALILGLPIVVNNIGAQPERVAHRPLTWSLDPKLPPEKVNDFFINLRQSKFENIQRFDESKSACDNWKVPKGDYTERIGIPAIPTSGNLGESLAATEIYSALIANRKAVDETSPRIILIGYLLRARHLPGLNRIARKIPLHFQKMVKDWILGAR